jgi:putative endonuclease
VSYSPKELRTSATTAVGSTVRKLIRRIGSWWRQSDPLPVNLERGRIGEEAAADYLKKNGLKLLARNFESKRGEIDLVLKEGDCLVFAEVKARNAGGWTRPAAAVDQKKRRNLSMAALDYLRTIKNPTIKVRFDIVEVLLDGDMVREVRHLPNSFEMEEPFRYG